MSYAEQMLETYPGTFGFDAGRLAAAIEAVHDCAQACTACADACLAEQDVAHLRACIQKNLNCADVCVTTGRTLSRQTEYDAAVTAPILEACVRTCNACAEECERHAGMGMEHCRVCAEACRRCEEACQSLLEAASA